MGADISRVRFDALRDHASVTLQQGRLLLDGDFNEYVAIIDRRLRAETVDLTSFGPDPDQAGSSWVPRQTPDGFRITTGPTDLTIGRGRMYVDGLLAENHGRVRADLSPEELEESGLAQDGFDPLLDESFGLVDTTYMTQPWWPTPDPLPDGAGPHLVYLDVWQREVTHLEDPDLVEIAVGVDTTTRTQTVWQVRLLANVGNGGCDTADDDLPDPWASLLQPTGARLTVTTVAVDDEDDPCVLPATGGYRGLENQTYRIEVHDPGGPGTATFKWSRDNGSVAMPIIEMVSLTELRLATVGRDAVLRVSTGDWVEVTDDRREFNRLSGAMRRVIVDDAARTITFDDDLDADLQPADADEAAARHLRVRRWDQSGTVRTAAGATVTNLDLPGATGVIDVPALPTTQVVLEHGIVVSFDVSIDGGQFRAGDHWIVAARTADTSVEELDQAPPLGIRHHFARLATVTFPESQTDCRRLWPPLFTGDGGDCGDCTVCVTAESHASGTLTIQMAVDQVRETGGTVCLGAGVFDLGDGVTIDQSRSVRLRGQGLATVLVGRGTVIRAAGAIDLVIERVAVVGGRESSAAIRLRNLVGGRLREVVALSFGSGDASSAALELGGIQAWTTVSDNLLIGQVGVRGGDAEVGVLSVALDIVDNLVGGDVGIDLGAGSAHVGSCRITSNEVMASSSGIRALGAVWPGGTLAVTDNVVGTRGTGIVTGGEARIDGNVVSGLGGQEGPDIGDATSHGILVVDGPLKLPPGDLQIAGNRVSDRGGTGIDVRTSIRSGLIVDNVITTVGTGIMLSGRASAEDLRLAGNTVREVTGLRDGAQTVWGIAISGVGALSLLDNTITDVGLDLVDAILRAGVVVGGCRDIRASGNVIDRVGPVEGFVGLSFGLVVTAPFDQALATENTIRFNGLSQPPSEGRWVALLVTPGGQALANTDEPLRLGRRHTVALDDGAMVFTHGWAMRVAQGVEHVTASDNLLTGGSRLATCHLQVNGDLVVDANQVEHLSEEQPIGLFLAGTSITASTNRIRGPRSMAVLVVEENRFSAVGNLAAGGTHLGGPFNGLPGPWDALNVDVP